VTTQGVRRWPQSSRRLRMDITSVTCKPGNLSKTRNHAPPERRSQGSTSGSIGRALTEWSPWVDARNLPSKEKAEAIVDRVTSPVGALVRASARRLARSIAEAARASAARSAPVDGSPSLRSSALPAIQFRSLAVATLQRMQKMISPLQREVEDKSCAVCNPLD